MKGALGLPPKKTSSRGKHRRNPFPSQKKRKQDEILIREHSPKNILPPAPTHLGPSLNVTHAYRSLGRRGKSHYVAQREALTSRALAPWA